MQTVDIGVGAAGGEVKAELCSQLLADETVAPEVLPGVQFRSVVVHTVEEDVKVWVAAKGCLPRPICRPERGLPNGGLFLFSASRCGA